MCDLTYGISEDHHTQLETAHHLAALLAAGAAALAQTNEDIPPAQAAAAFGVLAEHIGHVLRASLLIRQ